MKTAAAFFAYFLQLQAKSKREREGGRWGSPNIIIEIWVNGVYTNVGRIAIRPYIIWGNRRMWLNIFTPPSFGHLPCIRGGAFEDLF
jgi:hypothetical protein